MSLKLILQPTTALYLALGAALLLLAPYAGCHIVLTEAPPPVSLPEVASGSNAMESDLEPESGDHETGSSSGSSRGAEDLRDIEDLLSR